MINRKLILLLLLAAGIVACNMPRPGADAGSTPEAPAPTAALQEPSPTPPPSLLTVCMGQEPASLFLYGDNSLAARSVRQAIYDGPFDVVNYATQPVLLEKMPETGDGSLRIETVNVQPGTAIAASDGKLVSLEEGVS